MFGGTSHLYSPQVEFSASTFQNVVNESLDHGPLSSEAIQFVSAASANSPERTKEQSTSKLIAILPGNPHIRSVSEGIL